MKNNQNSNFNLSETEDKNFWEMVAARCKTPSHFLKVLMAFMDCTGKELSDKTGLHPSQISVMLTGRQKISLSAQLKLASAFDIPSRVLASIFLDYDLREKENIE